MSFHGIYIYIYIPVQSCQLQPGRFSSSRWLNKRDRQKLPDSSNNSTFIKPVESEFSYNFLCGFMFFIACVMLQHAELLLVDVPVMASVAGPVLDHAQDGLGPAHEERHRTLLPRPPLDAGEVGLGCQAPHAVLGHQVSRGVSSRGSLCHRIGEREELALHGLVPGFFRLHYPDLDLA